MWLGTLAPTGLVGRLSRRAWLGIAVGDRRFDLRTRPGLAACEHGRAICHRGVARLARLACRGHVRGSAHWLPQGWWGDSAGELGWALL